MVSKTATSKVTELAPLKITVRVDRNKGFEEVKFYYANLVDYARVVFALMAMATLNSYPWFTGFSIFTSYMLDWVDGPLARKYNQCSFFGMMLDWVADVLDEVLLLAWGAAIIEAPGFQYQLVARGLMMIKTLMVTLAISTSILDSVLSYVDMPYDVPNGADPKQSKFWYAFNLCLLEVNSSKMTYSELGTWAWCIANPWQIAVCLMGALPVCPWYVSVVVVFGAVPAIIDGWHQVAFFALLVKNWRELLKDKSSNGC